MAGFRVFASVNVNGLAFLSFGLCPSSDHLTSRSRAFELRYLVARLVQLSILLMETNKDASYFK